jgi:hypothetical protein
MVSRSVYLGNGVRVIMHLATGQLVTALVPSTDENASLTWDAGTAVTCYMPPRALRVLPVRGKTPPPQETNATP